MNYISEDIEFLIGMNEKKPILPPLASIAAYAEDKRMLPAGTPFPGRWRNSRTPYSVEIMDNMSPYSPIFHSIVLKGAQLGLTAAAECVCSYWMDENPSTILYVSATQSLLEKWALKRLDPLIDSCGFREKIFAQTDNKKARRTGDKIFTKEFIGGWLEMGSAQSPSSLRSDSVRILIRDEIDGAPAILTTGEGYWVDVSYARTNAWGSRKKILDYSTPGTFEASEINPLFEIGDQRQFLVPCPLCGKEQDLQFTSEKTVHGLKPDFKAGKLEDAYYICDFCHDAFFNFHKTRFLRAGKWAPTTEAEVKNVRSYQISSLYSPVGMMSFAEFYQKYLDAQKKADGMRTFTNLYLGRPFKESGSRPKLENIIELRGGYNSRVIPDGVIYLTMGIDVQRGSVKDPKNPPRIEFEVMGIGKYYKTWSIMYGRIEGRIDDAFAGAWEELNELASKGGLNFKRKDGMDFNVSIVFVDSGDGNFMNIIYEFTQRWNNTFPSKGFSALKRRKAERGDEAGPDNFIRYRKTKVNDNVILISVSTNYYKNNLYNSLKVQRQELYPQKPGFCEFPVDYGEPYFQMLTAEEKKSDGSFAETRRRNEALDVRVLCMCAGDVFLDTTVTNYKAAAKANGATDHELLALTHKTVLDIMANEKGVIQI